MDLMALNETIKKESIFAETMQKEIGKVIIGQEGMLEAVIMAMLTGGHVLIEGVPGLAKTLTISTMAKVIDVDFNRLQFTPDLLPTDLIGTMIFNPKTGAFSPKKGPIFSNIVLADEINRAPAKVQSALLEVMAERQVTIGDTTYVLEKPFLVLATQNPIEQEGTYPLPEAQMDRFMFKIKVEYPGKHEEMQILNRMTVEEMPDVTSVTTKEELLRIQKLVSSIFVDEKLKHYIVDLVIATREPQEYGLGHLSDLISIGVSPRATINLTKAAKAQAFIRGRGFVTVDDIKAIAPHVLRHRILLTYEADAENMTSDDVVAEILSQVEVD